MEVKDILKARRIELDLTMKEVANKVGVSEGTISRWESGNISNMRRDKIALLAKALNINPSVIMGWDDASDSYSIPTFLNIHKISTQTFPVLGKVACGKPILMSEEKEVYVKDGAGINANYILIASGDSMTGARINDGDLVFIREQKTVENGEIAAVAIGDEATLKRMYYYAEKAMLILKAANPAYEDMIYMNQELEDVHILGKAVAFQSDVK